VLAWLIESGIQEERISHSVNRAWLQFDASVNEMERLLQTKYHFYEHIDGGRKYIGCEDYSIPGSVAGHIDFVTPGVKLLATTGMGDIKKRSFSSSPNRKPIQNSMPAGVLAKIKHDPGMLLPFNFAQIF
jgi:tripeptidyl-peptidase-1